MMPMLKIAFWAGLVFLGGVGVFIGAIVMVTSWQNGAIILNTVQDGRPVVETISRAANADRYWQVLSLTGIAPAVLGAAAMWFGIRTFRR